MASWAPAIFFFFQHFFLFGRKILSIFSKKENKFFFAKMKKKVSSCTFISQPPAPPKNDFFFSLALFIPLSDCLASITSISNRFNGKALPDGRLKGPNTKQTIAYIPLEHKTPHVENFVLAIPTYWYLKSLTQTLKCALPRTQTLKFALPPTRTPNASRLNIGRVGSPTQGAGIGHVDFMLFVFISFALVTQREPSFQWNMGLHYMCQLCDKFNP